jgi:hypothetical protein
MKYYRLASADIAETIAASPGRRQRRKLQVKMRGIRRKFLGTVPPAAQFSLEKISKEMDILGAVLFRSAQTAKGGAGHHTASSCKKIQSSPLDG